MAKITINVEEYNSMLNRINVLETENVKYRKERDKYIDKVGELYDIFDIIKNLKIGERVFHLKTIINELLDKNE